MKHIYTLITLLLFLTGCSQTLTNPDTPSNEDTDPSKVAVIFFTMPETNTSTASDSDSQASIVVHNEGVYGNVEYVATLIHETVGGEILRIETMQDYPLNHEDLVEHVQQEKETQARPTLSSSFDTLEHIDTIFLGYPRWWYDLPMPLYTFFEDTDLSGKTIIPFTVHGGSGFSSTLETLKTFNPHATISDQGFAISRNNASTAKNAVLDWLDATYNKKGS